MSCAASHPACRMRGLRNWASTRRRTIWHCGRTALSFVVPIGTCWSPRTCSTRACARQAWRRSPRTSYIARLRAGRPSSAAARLLRPATRSRSCGPRRFSVSACGLCCSSRRGSSRSSTDLATPRCSVIWRCHWFPCWPRWSSPGCQSIWPTCSRSPASCMTNCSGWIRRSPTSPMGRSTSTRRNSWRAFCLKTWIFRVAGRRKAATRQTRPC